MGELSSLYEKIKTDTEDRNKALEATLGVSEKFWDDLNGLTATMKDLQDTVHQQEIPALEPKAIREQQDALEAIKEELDATQADIDLVHETGEELVGLIGDPERPEVEKNVEDLDTNWSMLNKKWAERQKNLDDALKKATNFQEELLVRIDLIVHYM